MADKKREDLKPCPFCGSDAYINHEIRYQGSYCTCSNKGNCDLAGKYIQYPKWQRRPQESKNIRFIKRIKLQIENTTKSQTQLAMIKEHLRSIGEEKAW